MAFAVFVLCSLIFHNGILLELVGADPVIEFTPTEIHLGFTDSLTVNCTFSVADHPGMSSLVSLILSRANSPDGNFIEIATSTSMTARSGNPPNTGCGSSNGLIDPAGVSFLNVQCDLPAASQSGWYKCSAQGFDSLGHVITIADKTEITAEFPTMENWGDRIRALESHMTNFEQTVAELGNQMTQIKLELDVMINNGIQNLSDYALHLEQEKSALQDDIKDSDTRAEVCIASLQDVMPGVISERQAHILDKFHNPLTYNKHEYYISRAPYSSLEESIVACKHYYGYLAIINDQAELSALSNFTRTVFGLQRAVISGTDSNHRHVWTLPFTNLSMPYLNWYSDQPNESVDSCVYLTPHASEMYDMPCANYTSSTYRFICEIPVV